MNKDTNTIGIVRQMVADGQVSQEVAEKYVPELKESEDEKIRKALIRFHKSTIDVDGIKGEDILAWLEKQGKETSWKPSKEEMGVLYSLAYITNQYDEHKEEVITRLYQDLKREFFNDSSYENMFPINKSIGDNVRRRSKIQVLEYARNLNTLEVKEVDLEEEIKLNYNPADGLEFEEYKRIAKYYFELGIKVTQKEV